MNTRCDTVDPMHRDAPSFPALTALTALVGLVVWGGGCAGPEPDPTEEIWLEGLGYGWELFNHRVSHVEIGVGRDGGWAAIVGGTSTTNELTDLPDGCDSGTCGEFPFVDEADVRLRWARVSSSDVVFARQRVELLATAEGASTTASVPLPRPVEGRAAVALAALSLDTDHELAGGPACYDPRLGWHPRRMAIALGTPALDDGGAAVSVQVDARFEAGRSLEDERQCIDEVCDQAQVPVVLEMVVLAGAVERTEVTRTFGQEFGYGDGPLNPDEQPPPPAQDLDAGDVLAITGIDWRFHQADPDGRGAYIRTLDVDLDADAGQVLAWASNYSPGTQLSGFEYDVTVAVTALSLDAVVTRGSVAENLDVEIDGDGAPVVHPLDL